MNLGSRESSSSVRLMVRIAWLSALSDTIDVGPDAVEDVAPVDGLVAPLDQQHEEIEVARDEGHLAAAAREDTAARRHDELAEAVTDHGAAVGHRIRPLRSSAPVGTPAPATTAAFLRCKRFHSHAASPEGPRKPLTVLVWDELRYSGYGLTEICGGATVGPPELPTGHT